MPVPQSQLLPLRPQAPPIGILGVAEEGYSHEVAVAAITSLMTYAAELYNKENGQYIGLTDRVLDLMRHIPYFCQNSPELLFETIPISHLDRFTGSLARWPETSEEREAARERMRQERELREEQLVPPHMLMLTTDRLWRCYTILIDTERGAVRFWDRAGDYYPTQHPGDIDVDVGLEEWQAYEDGPESWRLARTYRIRTFFDLWKEEFMVWNRELERMEEERKEDEEWEEMERRHEAEEEQAGEQKEEEQGMKEYWLARRMSVSFIEDFEPAEGFCLFMIPE
ncbi:hypothetical protein PG997_001746 [Apiospora hydei]|uniref:Uncharacterized protein n=1 Tax=Apiospora hydei TaxID=1337664 RepID=A0ABR1XED6_9PEZI